MYILILTIFTAGGVNISQHEYTSFDSCMSTGEMWKSGATINRSGITTTYLCAKK